MIASFHFLYKSQFTYIAISNYKSVILKFTAHTHNFPINKSVFSFVGPSPQAKQTRKVKSFDWKAKRKKTGHQKMQPSSLHKVCI
jgi:hypothetical protein